MRQCRLWGWRHTCWELAAGEAHAPPILDATSMSSLKVATVVPSLDIAGMEVMAVSLADGLRRRGHHVTFYCTNGLGALAPTAGEVHLVASRQWGTSIWPRALAVALRDSKADLVHIHNAPWLKGAWAARLAGLPVVHTFHGLPTRLTSAGILLMRGGAALTPAIATVSDSLREYAITRLHANPTRVRVIQNGIATTRIPAGGAKLRESLGLEPGTQLVGIIARFDPVKDHPTLLRAFATVAAQHPNANLVCIGDGPERGMIEKLVEETSMTSRVHLLGLRKDVPQLLPELDVVVLCSRAEGLPMSLLEAMAAGRPVISTAVGAIPSLLGDGAGLLVPPADVSALASALGESLSSPDRLAALGLAGQARVTERYGVDRMINSYEALYREVLARQVVNDQTRNRWRKSRAT